MRKKLVAWSKLGFRLNYSHIFCLLHLVSLFSSTFFLCLPFHLKKSFSPPPSLPLPTLSLSMINAQGQKSEEQCVVARLVARTSNQSIKAMKTNGCITLLSLPWSVIACHPPPSPPLCLRTPFYYAHHPSFLICLLFHCTRRLFHFSLFFFLLLKHINRLNLTRFFVVLMNNFVMNMY